MENPNTAWRPFEPCRENVRRAEQRTSESVFVVRQIEQLDAAARYVGYAVPSKSLIPYK